MPKKADANQSLFTAAARACGLLVQPIHEVGRGVPDLIVAGVDKNTGAIALWLVELKCNVWNFSSPAPSPAYWKDTLTPDELAWHEKWAATPVIINNRLRWILYKFHWLDSEIETRLAQLPFNPAVKAALRAVERRDGCVSPEIMATIEFD